MTYCPNKNFQPEDLLLGGLLFLGGLQKYWEKDM